MIIEKTINKKIGKEEYTNNLETKKITRNGETLLDYCIIAYNDNTLTIQRGNMITTTGLQDNPHKEIIKELLQPTKPKKQAQKKKSSKSTIKGQKKQTQKTKEDKEQKQ